MTYTVNLDAIKDVSTSTSSTIYKSGVYDIIIKKAYIKATKNGAKKLWLAYKLKDANKDGGVLFISLTNNNGSDNYQKVLLDKLLTICDIKEATITKADVVTKKGTTKEDCFLSLDNKEVKIWVRMSYSTYNGQIQESTDVMEFFRTTDKASAREIILQSDIGSRYAHCEKSFEMVKYNNNLTADDIKKWKDSEREKRLGNKPVESVPVVDIEDEIPF